MNEKQVIQVLEESRTLTGKELRDKTGLDELTLWRICNLSQDIVLKIVGKRFLRLDRTVQGLARLSPSIKREFLTYTVCGLKKYQDDINKRAKFLAKNIKKISRDKLDLAKKIITDVVESSEHRDKIEQNVCFVIAGDTVFDMAHLEARPERSTGELVRGSDLDIIVVADDGFPPDMMDQLDRDIHRVKHMYLIDPDHREEVDYIVKTISKAEEQLKFDKYEFMVASKILHEGLFMYGSQSLFDRIKTMLKTRKIPERIAELEKKAVWYRKEAELYLLEGTGNVTEEECLRLFYTREESEEIF